MKRYIRATISDISNEDTESKIDIALDPNTSVELLTQLASDRNSDVRLCVIANPNTPREVINNMLFTNGDARFLEKVALCMETPVYVLDILGNASDDSVRLAVARNTHTSPFTLSNLAKDDNAAIRWTVAGNKSLPPDSLEQLSEDWNPTVRGEVAENLNTPITIVENLLNDEVETVRQLAKRVYRWRVNNGRV